jgi:pimeloyl-ACP methyl ester carboxylesterase
MPPEIPPGNRRHTVAKGEITGCWKAVCDIQDGYNASIVQEPETSFADDVAATKRVLAQQDGPCILVAHSYGGAVITERAQIHSVVGLVYIATHMPDAGEKESDDGKRFPSDRAKSGATCVALLDAWPFASFWSSRRSSAN